MAGIKCFNNDFIWTEDLGDLAKGSIADNFQEQNSIPTQHHIISPLASGEPLTWVMAGKRDPAEVLQLEGKCWVLGVKAQK